MIQVKRDTYKRLVAAAKNAIHSRSVEAIEHGSAIESTEEAVKDEIALSNAQRTFKVALVGAARAHELAKSILLRAKKNVESRKKWFQQTNNTVSGLEVKEKAARTAIKMAEKHVQMAVNAGLMHDMRGVWTMLDRLAVAHLASLQNRVVDVQLTVDSQKGMKELANKSLVALNEDLNEKSRTYQLCKSMLPPCEMRLARHQRIL